VTLQIDEADSSISKICSGAPTIYVSCTISLALDAQHSSAAGFDPTTNRIDSGILHTSAGSLIHVLEETGTPIYV